MSIIKTLTFILLASLLVLSLPMNAKKVVKKQATPIAELPAAKPFIRQMAKKHGFSEKHLTQLFMQVHVNQKVLRAMSRPYEDKPWYVYKKLFVTESRTKEGVAFWQHHKKSLQDAELKYGVPASIIVAIIGVETLYGKNKGDFSVLEALSTLAFAYPKRAKFFKKELKEYLLLTREQKLDPLKLYGSYAGAIGYPQFMPSSYRHYAVDYTHNGSIDLMSDPGDAIASVGNYLQKNGWQRGKPITAKATITQPPDQTLIKKRKKLTLKRLKSKGIHIKEKIKNTSLAGLMKFKTTQKKTAYWLAFHNFNVITRYNTSNRYAMAVYQLSKKLEARRKR